MLTTEDRERLRRMAEAQLLEADFENFCQNMVASLFRRKGLTGEQAEAFVRAFFEVLFNKMLDARRRLLDELSSRSGVKIHGGESSGKPS